MSGVGTRTVSNRPCSVPFVAFSIRRLKAEELVCVRKDRAKFVTLVLKNRPTTVNCRGMGTTGITFTFTFGQVVRREILPTKHRVGERY